MHWASTELRRKHTQAFFLLTHSSVEFFAHKQTFSPFSCRCHTYLIHMYLSIHYLSIITNHSTHHTLPRHAYLLPSYVQSDFPRSCRRRSVKYLRFRVRKHVQKDGCVCVSECVGVKLTERWGEAMSPGGAPPCGEQIAWAIKGLKVSGVPSPPQTG